MKFGFQQICIKRMFLFKLSRHIYNNVIIWSVIELKIVYWPYLYMKYAFGAVAKCQSECASNVHRSGGKSASSSNEAKVMPST